MSFLCPYSFKKKDIDENKLVPPDAYISSKTQTRSDSKQSGHDRYQNIRNGVNTVALLEVVQDYFACSALELPVKAGEIVNFLENEGAWVFVRAEIGANGYIPRRYCRLFEASNKRQYAIESADVGYYSDRIGNDELSERRVYINGKDRHEHSPNYNTPKGHDSFQKRFYSSKNDTILTSSSVSPASSLSNGMTNERTPEFTKYYNLTDTKGLYTRHNKNSDMIHKYKPEVSPRMQRYSREGPSTQGPICGRRCQGGCIHGAEHRETQKKRRPRANSVRCDTHKSSVISVASGKLEENSIGQSRENINPSLYQDEIKQNTSQNMNTLPNSVQKKLKIPTIKIKDVKTRQNRSQSAPPSILSKCGHPELIVIQDYEHVGETDITVDRGDFAAILNDTKYIDWMYIFNEKGERGYIPKTCAIKHECENCKEGSYAEEHLTNRIHKSKDRSSYAGNDYNTDVRRSRPKIETPSNQANKRSNYNSKNSNDDPTKYDIPNIEDMIQMVVHEGYSGKDLDDLYVCVGDFIYVSKHDQSIQDWLWVYSPKQNCSGYIPKHVVKATTDVEHIAKV